jgi:hypothetical protein
MRRATSSATRSLERGTPRKATVSETAKVEALSHRTPVAPTTEMSPR